MTAPCFSLGRPEVSFRFFPRLSPSIVLSGGEVGRLFCESSSGWSLLLPSHTPAMCYRLTGAAVLWQIFVTSMAVNWCVWILVCPRQWIIFLLFFHIPALKLKLKYPAGNSHAVWFSSHTCCANPGQTAEQKAKDLPATYLILTRIQPALIPPVRFLEIFKKEFWSVSQLL